MGIRGNKTEAVGRSLSVPTRSWLYFMFSVSAFGLARGLCERVTVRRSDHLCGPLLAQSLTERVIGRFTQTHVCTSILTRTNIYITHCQAADNTSLGDPVSVVLYDNLWNSLLLSGQSIPSRNSLTFEELFAFWMRCLLGKYEAAASCWAYR